MAKVLSNWTISLIIVVNMGIRLLGAVSISIATDSSVGLEILGGIFSGTEDSPSNTVLLKNTKDNSVKAWKVGQEFQIPNLGLIRIMGATKNYMILESNQNKSKIKIVRDGFAKNEDHKLVVESIKKSPWVQDTYKEEGFERNLGVVKMTETYRQQVMKDLPKIVMQAAAEPVIRSGEIVGWQISEVEKNSLYEKAGVQDGDVITAINDRPLDDAAKTVVYLNSLRKADHVELRLLRGGQEISLNLDVSP